MAKGSDLQKGELYVRMGGTVQRKKIENLEMANDPITKQRLQAITLDKGINPLMAMALGIRGKSKDNPASHFFLDKSSVSGMSAFAKSSFDTDDLVMSIIDANVKTGVPYIASAPTEKSLERFVRDERLRALCATACVDIHALREDHSEKGITYVFKARRHIEPGEILTQDYIYCTASNQLMVGATVHIFDWVRQGVAPELIQKDGTAVPNIDGQVHTLYISGIKKEGEKYKLDAGFIDPTQYTIDATQSIIGKPGTTLYAYDQRLHTAFAKVLTKDPIIASTSAQQLEVLLQHKYPAQLVRITQNQEQEASPAIGLQPAAAAPQLPQTQEKAEQKAEQRADNFKKLEEGFSNLALAQKEAAKGQKSK